MCDDHGPGPDHDVLSMDPRDDPALGGGLHPSRRTVVAGGVGGVAGILGSGFLPFGAPAATAATPFTDAQLVRSAMHVHGSWDEGQGSWESQFAQADSLGLQVLYMSTHDYRAEAYNYLPSLAGVVFDAAKKTGTLAQGSVANNAGTVRVVAQSANSSPASFTAPMQAKPMAANRLRTSIAGQVMTVRFPASRIDAGGMYELVVDLSNHPQFGNHKVGQYQLRYRFGNFTKGRTLDASGLVGIVTNPKPAAGAAFTFTPTDDVAALWPDLVAFDNTFFMLSFAATSPAQSAVTDVSVTIQFARSKNNATDLSSLHNQLVTAYASRHPGLTVYPTVEVSRFDPLHVIGFGLANQLWYDQSLITKPTVHQAYTQLADTIHAQGGLMSMNHPFGPSDQLGPPGGMEALRAQTYTTLNNVNVDHADILEVGYSKRGGADLNTHLALWDTFTRNGRFLTGTGVNDDHGGVNWKGLGNGFVTAMWAVNRTQAALVTALAGGRVFTYHPQRWATAQLDTLMEDGTRMGQVSSSGATARTLTIYAPTVPGSASVRVLTGPVDKGGNSVALTTAATLPGSRFTGSGVVAVPLTVSRPSFLRVAVVLANGTIAAASNPTWLFPTPPAGVTVPHARVSATA